jgi:5-methylcytosine-specific restriction endonuclease McrA
VTVIDTLKAWQDETRPNGATNTVRPLIHLIDSGDRGPAMQASKLCRRCGITKLRSEFYPRSERGPEAVTSKCKSCSIAQARAWQSANLDRVAAWQAANRDRVAAINRRWREKPESKPILIALEARRDPKAHAAKEARRRARVRSTFTERIDYRLVLQMHDGICGICGTLVDPECYEVDHVVALANGGTHTYDNVQPAHPLCNRRKGAR